MAYKFMVGLFAFGCDLWIVFLWVKLVILSDCLFGFLLNVF